MEIDECIDMELEMDDDAMKLVEADEVSGDEL